MLVETKWKGFFHGDSTKVIRFNIIPEWLIIDIDLIDCNVLYVRDIITSSKNNLH